MKKIILFLICFLFQQAIYSQAGTGFTIQGNSASNVTVNCNDNATPFVYMTLENYCNPNISYQVELLRNGVVISTQNFSGSDAALECFYSDSGVLLSSPPIIGNFNINNPQPGTYRVHFRATLFALVLQEYDSNTIVLNNPFYGNVYLGCGNSYDNSFTSCRDDLRVFDFENDSLLFVLMDSGLMYKVKKAYGTGFNMLAIDDDTYGSLPLYNYIIGYHDFGKKINAVEYTSDNKLLIGFNDGKILKINGLGGGGNNMFAITETGSGFSGIPGYNYYVGHHKFNSGITEIKNISGYTFICLSSGKVLKVNGSGGSGANVFAISETSSGFNPIPGYNYYSGQAKFNGSVYKIFSNLTHTFFSFNNNKLLKINSVGGTGMNMFALEETANGFTPFPGYNYYSGQTLLSGKVTDIEFQGAYTTLGFSNGKLLKVNGTGGTGMNMFAITENANGFTPIPGYNYYVGHVKYNSGVKNILTPQSNFSKNVTFITFENGKLLKVFGIGGTGSNMYNATEMPSGFNITSASYTNYISGSSRFDTEPTDIAFIPQSNQTVLCFGNRKAFKSTGYGGSGYNCFGVSQETNGFAPLVGFNYVTGSQLFPCANGLFNKNGITEDKTTSVNVNDANQIKIINPFTNELAIDLSNFNDLKQSSIEINNINGQLIYKGTITSSFEVINTEAWASGMYFCTITINNENFYKKIIKE